MRRSLILIIFIILLFAIPLDTKNQAQESQLNLPMDDSLVSSAGGAGNDENSMLYMSRSLTDWSTDILNTYESPNIHQNLLDLSSHHISGWTLFKAEINVDNITAAPEREVLVTSPNGYIEIWNDTGDVYDALYQAFYFQSHDGKLENYSIGYRAPYYNSDNGDAYLGVWADYTDYTTAVTSLVTPFVQTSSVTMTTHDTSGDNAILSASTYYYVVINGTHMDGVPPPPVWLFNIIQWRSTDAFEGFDTGYRYRNDGFWYDYSGPIARQEAELNYTYTPWNSVGGAPWVYAQPEDIALEVNSTAMTGSSWSFEASSSNITTLQFDSSQSVYVNHDITLWYKKTITTSNAWDVQQSGNIVDWNATTVASYPSVSGTLARYANITVGGDWTVSGLYDSASPSVNYGNYVDYGTYIQCSNMYDETWTLTFTGHNHVTSLATNVAAVNSSVISILSNVDIEALIEQADTSAVSTGNANLSIWHDESMRVTQEDPVSDGTFSYAWDIDATESDNGTYSILVYWTNGTEAGYREFPVVVYFPTSLNAASTYVEGYADSTVAISVFFNDTFTPKALDASFASVIYYNGTHNNTMTDHANGTWTAAVDTTGWTLGSYPITVYAEGYAIENQTIDITIAVVEPSYTLDGLHVWWNLDDNNISYIETAQLRVNYSTISGSVAGATVNVTDGTTFWNLNWDGGTETYWVDLAGSYFSGLGTHPLTVSAWKEGVETQVNDTLEIIIVEEVTILTPSWPSTTFDYSQNVNFSAIYTDHLGTPIAGASQADITINGTLFFLNDAGNGTYWIELDKAHNLGYHTMLVTIGKLGYETAIDSSIWFVIDIANTNVDLSPVSPMQVYYTHSDSLTITLSDDEGDPIDNAIVWLEYDSSNYTLREIDVGVFQILINGSDGLGPYPIRVFTFNYGFTNESLSGMQIDIVETPTSLDASGTRIVGVYTTLYNDGSITFNVLYEDIDSNELTAALANVTINGKTYDLSAGPMNFTFTIEARMIGIGSFSAVIRADLFGYEGATLVYPVVVEPVPTHIDTPDVFPSVMYLNQTLPTISIRYWDNNAGTWLTPDNATFIWSNPLGESALPDLSGWYHITLSSDQLSLGQHLLNITFASTNFTTASITMFITVRPVNTDFYVLGAYSTYENETVQLRVYYHDRDHDVPISWANVVATLVGADYPMNYDDASIYIADVRANLEWGSYQFSISATATGCASNSTTVGLALSEKDHVYVKIIHPVPPLDFNPVEGLSTNIAALVEYNNSVQTERMPLGSVSVQFLVTIELSNGTILTWSHADTTDDEGVASWAFPMPQADISNMTVDAWYLGSTTRWSARAESQDVKVGFDFLQQMIRFLSSDLGIMMILSLAVIGTVAVGYNKRFKPKKREAQRNLMRQLDSFKELDTLQHFMAVYIDRGTCVFYHPFKETRIQPDLISGFIAAITSVYGEIKGDGVQGSLEEINYQGLRLNSYSGKYIIGIVIVEGDMSARLRDRLQFFVELFEDQYQTDLDGWTGLVDCFDPEWVVSNLNTAFNYDWMLPHQIVRKVRVKGQLAKVLKHIHTKFGDGEFLLLGIVEEIAGLLGVTDAEAFDVLLRLEDSGAIKPISIHTVLQRQGLGIAEEDEGLSYETSAPFEAQPEVVHVPAPVEELEAEPEPEPVPEPEPPPEPEPEAVEALEPEPEPVKEEKAEEVSEEDKFLTDVFALMEEEDKQKKDKKKKE